MRLYHGSAVSGIRRLRPGLSNHQKPYVYLTDDPALAVFYAHNPLDPPNGWFTYFYREGALHYEEYFPDQLEELYKGFGGYVYTCDGADLPRLDRMPWVHLSEVEVPVVSCRFIPDLYEEIMALAAAGRVTLHRYAERGEQALASDRAILLREIEERHLREHPEDAYAQFIHRHFPELL